MEPRLGLDLDVGELAVEQAQLAAQILVVALMRQRLLPLADVELRDGLAEAAVHGVRVVERGWAADSDPYEAPDSEQPDQMYLERQRSAEVLELL